jgi:hypothetical protein
VCRRPRIQRALSQRKLQAKKPRWKRGFFVGTFVE